MKYRPNRQFAEAANRQGSTRTSKAQHLFTKQVTRAGSVGLLLLSLSCGVAAAQDDAAQSNSPTQLRQFIGQQVGGIDKLKVPATDADIPVPRMPDGTVNYRYQTTEAKRYLGKLLFHDPVRTARIGNARFGNNTNQGQPVPLPPGTDFGGTVSDSDPNIQAIVNATKQTGSWKSSLPR